MSLEVDIYNRFYNDLSSEDYWAFELQKDLAKEAVSYFVLFNKLIDLDLERITEPFIFTKLDVYQKCKSLLECPDDYSISVDSNGGISAIYMGEKEAIVTVDLDIEKNIYLEYIDLDRGVLVKASYSNRLAVETVKYEINKFLEGII